MTPSKFRTFPKIDFDGFRLGDLHQKLAFPVG